MWSLNMDEVLIKCSVFIHNSNLKLIFKIQFRYLNSKFKFKIHIQNSDSKYEFKTQVPQEVMYLRDLFQNKCLQYHNFITIISLVLYYGEWISTHGK